jgi:hypothetical protein
MVRLPLLLIICICTKCFVRAQVVNIEQARIKADTSTWAGHVQGNFFAQRIAQSLVSATLRSTVQYRKDKNLWLLLADVGFSKAENVELSNSALAHLRYNRKLLSFLKAEAFAQLQQNRVLGLDRRSLLGAGLRLKLLEEGKTRSYFGTLMMLEQEVERNAEFPTYYGRLSAYLTVTIAKSSLWSYSGTTYYQPLAADFSDYRLAGQHAFSLVITKGWSLRTELTHFYDAKPPQGIVASTFTTSIGIGVDL